LKIIINKVEMSWQKVLSDKGYRVSGPRRLVMGLLAESAQPMTPLEIYQELSQSGQALGMVSVYRALELLAELGLVCVVYNPDGSSGYVAGSVGHHHHILCKKCHRAITFAGSEDLSDLIRRVEAETKFQVSDHLLQLYGICPDCQKILADILEEN
jgi:Fur family ferric uptake transcriptional regulator